MKILLCKHKQYIAEENRFGHRQWLEMPTNILTTAQYLKAKSFNVDFVLFDEDTLIDFTQYDIVVQWVSLADGLKNGLDVFKEAKKFNCLNLLMLFDDWEKTALQVMQDFNYIDYAIRGLDREINLEILLEYLQEKKPFPKSGIVYRKNNMVMDLGLSTIQKDLLHLKSAKTYIQQLLDQFSFQKYFVKVSSGCPYPCTFCHIRLRPNRFRDVEDVIDEVLTIPENSAVQLSSADVLQNESWVEEFCNMIINSGKKYTFETDIRIDNAKNIELLHLMKKAGFTQLAIGIESYDTTVSKSMKKGYSHKKIENGFNLLLEAGLNPAINFMIGHYLDSNETLQNTKEEIEKLDPRIKIIGFQYLRPLPGTQIEKESIEENVLEFPLNYRDFVQSRHEPVMPTKFLSKGDLKIWMEFFESIRTDENENYYFAKNLDNCGNDLSLSTKVVSVAPHPISLYENNLKSLQEKNYNFITSKEFYANKYDPKKLNLLLRHDIDFRPNKIELFTDIETSLNVRSDIYVILDDEYYDIKPHITKLKKLAEDGFLLGLHTLAPGNANYQEILSQEIDLFEEYFGFKPEYFTIHGKSPHPNNWTELRKEFLAYVQENKDTLPFKGTHNIKGPYDWVEDISIQGGEYSVLRRKFFEIPKNYYYGVIGILTHPIHWDVSDIRWEISNNDWKSILK